MNSFSMVSSCALIHPTNADTCLARPERSLTFSANPQTWINQTVNLLLSQVLAARETMQICVSELHSISFT